MQPESRRTRRNGVEDAARHRQLRRLERRRERVERLALVRGRFPLHGRAAVAAHRVDEVLPADHRRRAFDRVAVIHPDRHERLFDRRHRRAEPDRALADARERRVTDLHDPRELVGLIQPVRPLLDARVNVHVLVREVPDVLRPRVVDDLGQRFRLVRACRELAVAEGDRHLVPVADARLIRVLDVDRSVFFERLQGMRVVHDRDPALAAVVVVVPEAERVPDLVRSELPDARERRLVENVGPLVAGRVRREQAFEDHVVLTVAQRSERDRAAEDLAGARVGDRSAGAPAARRSMDPVDHAVADVHRSAPSGSTSTLKPLRKPAASNACVHQRAPSSSACLTSSGAPEST